MSLRGVMTPSTVGVMTPTAKIGRVQRQVLLCLSDGTSRTTSRIEMDMMLDGGAAWSALQGLWRRGLVDRAYSYNEIEWHLTRAGGEVADALFPDGDDEA